MKEFIKCFLVGFFVFLLLLIIFCSFIFVGCCLIAKIIVGIVLGIAVFFISYFMGFLIRSDNSCFRFFRD